MLSLGIDGFVFADLYRPVGLARLHARFLEQLRGGDAELGKQFDSYRHAIVAGTAHGALNAPQESDLLVRVAEHVSHFVAVLFGATPQLEQRRQELVSELRLFEFKREFVTRRVFKKGTTDRPVRDELPALDARMTLMLALGFGAKAPPAVPSHHAAHTHHAEDFERELAESVLTLINIERHFAGQLKEPKPELVTRWAALRSALLSTPPGTEAFGSTLIGEDLAQVRGLLSLADRWAWARASFTHTFHGWSTIAQPKPLVFDKLVELKVPDANMPEAFEGPDQHLRRRDGFGLTDRRFDDRQVMNEVDYCVICHEREKDTCSKGFKERDPLPPATPTRKTRSAFHSRGARSKSKFQRCICSSAEAIRWGPWR